MAHPLKDYVRGVQDELDRTGRKASYQFCLNMVQKHFAAAKTSAEAGANATGKERKAAVIVRLVEMIAPSLRPAKGAAS